MNNKLDKNNYPIITNKGKDWPDNNKMANFKDIADPIIKALKIAMKKGDKVYQEGIEWEGLKQGPANNHICFNPSESLHAKNLTSSKESQGRDIYIEIISIAIQLGFEQGRREVITQLNDLKFALNSEVGPELLEIITRDK